MTLGRSLESARRERWGVILAGGNGFRLRPLTSRQVLARHPAHLAVLPVGGTGWADLGDPARVGLIRRQVVGRLDPLVA
jgi:hypothetical protein